MEARMEDRLLTNAADKELYLERLPWYVNGTLVGDERAWMDSAVQNSPWAAEMLARERQLKRAAVEHFSSTTQADVGLARLMARVRSDAAKENAATPRSITAPASGLGKGMASWLGKLSQFLAQPALAMATVAVVLVQSSVIGWLVTQPTPEASEYRSFGAAEMRTLRVTFVAGASEVGIRAALRAAGSRVVGGPNLVGEYWIASSIKSLDEVKSVLQASGQVATIEVDIAGPRGQ